MRDLLAPLAGRRHRFRAVVDRMGATPRTGDLAVLLTRLSDPASGQVLADHVWVRLEGRAAETRFPFGRWIAFTAAVVRYRRAAGGTDYCLAGLRDVRPADRRGERTGEEMTVGD